MKTNQIHSHAGHAAETCDPEHRPEPMHRLAGGKTDGPAATHGLLVPVNHLELLAASHATLFRETALSALDFP
ncbi:hypothetical protein DB347_12335 [Opitutaceae bacterium EW11]|nr:hypothetical protein DB347_12335 [Opitutaceae bacterium EW11]